MPELYAGVSTVEVKIPQGASHPNAAPLPPGDGPSEEALRGETCVLCLTKRDGAQQVGLELGHSKDGRWLVVSSVVPGTLCAVFSELKPGAKLLDIRANGALHRQPPLEQAAALLHEAVGEVELTIMPLLDRYGFIVSAADFLAAPITRDMLRYENSQLRKWQRRVATPRQWQQYAERKPEKLRRRMRQGVPDAVRGFVWKLIAAGRAPEDFRREGMYATLISREDRLPCFPQIDKDVPRTMTEHIYFRGSEKAGQHALTRLLYAYACFNPALGYTQGMSSYAAILLLYMTEEDAFWTFAVLMQHCGLQRLFTDGFPLLTQCYDVWQSLLHKHLPKASHHIRKHLLGFLGIEQAEYDEMVRSAEPSRSMLPGMYTTYWFQSMLVGGDNPAPAAVAPRLMDCILLEGNLSVIYQVGLALLATHQRDLLQASADGVAELLKGLPKRCGNIDALLARAHEFKIKPKHLGNTERL